MKRKLSVMAAALVLTLTQTGCVVGFALGPWGMPFWAAGVGTGIVGSALTLGGLAGGSQGLTSFGASMMIAGAILDEENPGRVDSLNPIPMSQSVAHKIGVSLSDIENYNYELDHKIPEAATQLAQDLRGPIQQINKGLSKSGKFDLAKVEGIEHLASKYGFDGAEDLMNTAKQQSLSKAQLARFAKGLNLSESETQILLFTSFGIKTQ